MGYYSQQQTETLDVNGTVLGEMRRLSDPRTTEEELMSVLGLFLLGQGYFDRFISSLSGGERSRLALAVLFLARCNFLVLDEPTNHLDLESREALVEALDAFDGTLLLVAHDRHLLSEAVDEIWAIGENGITVYEGGFEEYDAARRAAKVSARAEVAPGGGAPAGLSREELKRLKREPGRAAQRHLQTTQAVADPVRRTGKKAGSRVGAARRGGTTAGHAEVYADGARASALLKEFHELQTQSERELEDLAELEARIADLEARRAALSLED